MLAGLPRVNRKFDYGPFHHTCRSSRFKSEMRPSPAGVECIPVPFTCQLSLQNVPLADTLYEGASYVGSKLAPSIGGRFAIRGAAVFL